MSTHTPGPWVVNPYGCEFEENSVFAPTLASGQRQVICFAPVGKHAMPNLRLIAAAPDLLNALRSLLRHVERARESDLLDCDDTGPEDMARDAIAKAEGR